MENAGPAPDKTSLYLVPTPIGNLDDITLRALKVLKEVDGILAEDTRTAGKLLKHLGISKTLSPFHAFNEHRAVSGVVQRMLRGETLALVADAGTPGISDPGFLLVRASIDAGLKLTCLPGATAFVPALVNSGLAADRFVFEGFLPHKKGRQTRIKALAAEERTLVFYESPHRLLKLLEELQTAFGGDRLAAVGRELSKMFEENARDTLDGLHRHFSAKQVKGEIVVVVEGLAAKERRDKKDSAEQETEQP